MMMLSIGQRSIGATPKGDSNSARIWKHIPSLTGRFLNRNFAQKSNGNGALCPKNPDANATECCGPRKRFDANQEDCCGPHSLVLCPSVCLSACISVAF